MTPRLDRRSFLLTGSLGIGALALPGVADALSVAALRGFTHGVASGEPASDSVLLWTRYVPARGGAVELDVELAATDAFAGIVGRGAVVTGPWRDHTAKITVAGLDPATSYFYRFVAPDGTRSPIGRTRTLPEGKATRWRAAIFSCSNLPYGYFNAYGHAARAAAAGELDAAIHLGDYFYEYRIGEYPKSIEAVAGRAIEPGGEAIHLADYRLRYASYRADPDLQALHRLVPWIVQWDDHESANDSWEGGAENHQPNEGDWDTRKLAAMQVYREWMPVSDEPWKAYDIGTLATLFRTETRLLARTRQPDAARLFTSRHPAAALKAFRDGPWQDPAATMMGTQQEVWLDHAIRTSVASGARWQVVGFGTVMGNTVMPAITRDWIDPSTPLAARIGINGGIEAAKLGLPFNYDDWGGYPAARARFLCGAQHAGANLIVITGDSHNAWAYDLAQDGRPAGVEFAGHSVTSPGYESALKIDPARVAAALVETNPELKWCDTSRRGYMMMTLTPERASNDWIFVDTVRRRSLAASTGHSASVAPGRNVMA